MWEPVSWDSHKNVSVTQHFLSQRSATRQETLFSGDSLRSRGTRSVALCAHTDSVRQSLSVSIKQLVCPSYVTETV